MKTPVLLLSVALLAGCCDPTAVPKAVVDAQRDSLNAVIAKQRSNLDSLSKQIAAIQALSPGRAKEIPTVRQPYMDNIDWLWTTNDPPQQLRCTAFMVNGNGVPVPRGMTTAHECVIHALEAYKDDNIDFAINWLKAGQCHNPAAQQDLQNNRDAALSYAYQKYGPMVLK